MCEENSLGIIRDKREWGLLAMSEGEPTLPSACSLGPSEERGSGQEQMGIVGVEGMVSQSSHQTQILF